MFYRADMHNEWSVCLQIACELQQTITKSSSLQSYCSGQWVIVFKSKYSLSLQARRRLLSQVGADALRRDDAAQLLRHELLSRRVVLAPVGEVACHARCDLPVDAVNLRTVSSTVCEFTLQVVVLLSVYSDESYAAKPWQQVGEVTNLEDGIGIELVPRACRRTQVHLLHAMQRSRTPVRIRKYSSAMEQHNVGRTILGMEVDR